MTGRFRLLHLRRLRTHPGRISLSVAAVAVGTALLATVLAVRASILGSIDDLVELAGRADVEVSSVGDAGFPQDLFFEVEETPGVEAAVPAVRSRVTLSDREVLLLGLDDRARALDQELARRADEELAETDLDGVFLPAGLAADLGLREGDRVSVYGSGATTETRVAGVVEELGAEVNEGDYAIAALPVAQRLAGKPDRLDAVWALAEDGTGSGELRARLDERLGDRAIVSSPRLRAEQVAEEVAGLEQELLVIAGAVLVVAGFLVFNTMTMTALERRRELATLRALGGRRGPLRRGLVGEAALLGAVGSVAGAAAGVTVARGVVDNLPAAFESGLGVGISFHLPPSVLALTALVGVGATMLAAVVPARRATAIAPVEAMRPEGVLETGTGELRVAWTAALGGLAALAGGVLLTAGAVRDLVVLGGSLIVVGALVSTWGFTAPLTRAASWIAGRFRAPGALASTSLSRAPRRTWSTTAGITVAVALVVTIGGLRANTDRTVRTQFASLADMDVVVQSAPLDDFPVTTMPLEWEQELAALDGVASVHRGQFVDVTIGVHRVVLQGFERGANEPVFRLASESARRAMLAGEGALVTSEFARAHGVEEGDVLSISTPSGARPLRVLETVGFVGGGLASGGLAALPAGVIEEWFDRPGASWYELDLEAGASRGEVADRVEETLAGRTAPAFVGTGEALYDRAIGFSETFNAIFEALGWIAAVAGALGIVNTLMLSVLERRREVGILRAMGTSRRQVLGMVLAEAVAISAVGAGIGAAIGVLMHWAGVKGAEGLFGFPIEYAFAVEPLVLAAVIALAMSALGGLGPGRRAARVNVIAAIGYE